MKYLINPTCHSLQSRNSFFKSQLQTSTFGFVIVFFSPWTETEVWKLLSQTRIPDGLSDWNPVLDQRLCWLLLLWRGPVRGSDLCDSSGVCCEWGRGGGGGVKGRRGRQFYIALTGSVALTTADQSRRSHLLWTCVSHDLLPHNWTELFFHTA